MDKAIEYAISHIYDLLLHACGQLLPRRFLLENKNIIPKDTPAFTLYLKLLRGYIHILNDIEKSNPSFIQLLQTARLQRVLKAAHSTVWWKFYFIRHQITFQSERNLNDLKKIPPVTRFDVMDVPKDDLLTCSKRDPQLLWRQTSGSTTGTPLLWGVSKSLLVVNTLAHFLKAIESLKPPFLYEPARDFYIQFNYGLGSDRSDFRWFSKGDFYIYSNDPLRDIKFRRMCEILEETGGGIVRTSPSVLPFLIQELRAQDLHPPISVMTIVGEPLDDGVRALVQEYLGCKILVFYGTQEAGSLGIECPLSRGCYHIFPERAIIEILDNQGEPVDTNVIGNVTITCLDNTIMPLLRYQPGDFGLLHDSFECECGNTSPLLEIRNRSTEYIKMPDGTTKSPNSIFKRFNTEPFVSQVRRVQVQQTTLDTVSILIEVRRHIEEGPLLKLQKRLQKSYKDKIKITFKQTTSIPQEGPKFRKFIPLI